MKEFKDTFKYPTVEQEREHGRIEVFYEEGGGEMNIDKAFTEEGKELAFNQGALLETIKQYEETIKSLERIVKYHKARPPLSNTMIFWAFRYCLGRSTYAVADCVEYLVHYWDKIEKRTREQIIKELFEACEKKDCGMEQDKSQWHRVLRRAGIKIVDWKDPYCKITVSKKELGKEEPCTTKQTGKK